MIAYCEHEARMGRRDDKGVPLRQHLEARARKGNAFAIRELAGPAQPEALAYLYGWAMELHARSGVGMAGLAPLSYGTVRDWAVLTDRDVRPHEVSALLALDAALMAPPVE